MMKEFEGMKKYGYDLQSEEMEQYIKSLGTFFYGADDIDSNSKLFRIISDEVEDNDVARICGFGLGKIIGGNYDGQLFMYDLHRGFDFELRLVVYLSVNNEDFYDERLYEMKQKEGFGYIEDILEDTMFCIIKGLLERKYDHARKRFNPFHR